MALSNTLKKMIVFSSEATRKLLEGMIKDQSADTGASESAIIEQALAQALLPENENAVFWIERLYNGGTLAEAYYNVFAFLAAGAWWDAKYPNGKPLVSEFCKVLAMEFPTLSGEEREIHHLLSQLDSIYEMLPDGGHTSDKALCKICIDQLKNDPESVYLIDMSSMILRNWETLGNHTRTYRALADLARLSAPRLRDTSRTRRQFIAALDTVSKDWQDDA